MAQVTTTTGLFATCERCGKELEFTEDGYCIQHATNHECSIAYGPPDSDRTGPVMPMAQGRSAQLRRAFEELPEGTGKVFVRWRAQNLLRDGGSMEDAMEQALTDAASLFPEMMLVVRCRQDRPFERSDMFMIQETATVAMELREQINEWQEALASGEIVKGKGKGAPRNGSSMADAAFNAFSGKGHRMSD